MKADCLVRKVTLRVWRRLPLVAFLLLMADSLNGASMPSASKSEYFRTEGAMFVLNREQMAFQYWLLLSVSKPLPAHAIVEVIFENPTNKTSTLTLTRQVSALDKELKLESGHISGLKYRKNYGVEVRLFADGEKTKVISTHKQQIQYAIPPRELKRVTEAWKEKR
jgi:hypothetical protein